MKVTSFSDYARSPALSADAIYTVELLIERARMNFDPDYWDEWSRRGDAREEPDYEPHVSMEYVSRAEEELKSFSWVSLQRQRNAERPVRDLNAIQFLLELSSLILINNEVTEISPLVACAKLKRLSLQKNPITDISAIAGCKNLEELDIGDSPIEDLSALQCLPKLRELTISSDQIAALRRVKSLPSLRKLELGLDTFDSFENFPQMPELRVIRGAHVNSLKGLERFPKLQNLVNFSGVFSTLEPLRNSKNLSHINILSSRIQSLEPLSGLSALRELRLDTESSKIDLTPLQVLPKLHELTVKCKGSEFPAVDKLRDSLSNWDTEFRAPYPRHTPSLLLEVVDQNTFDIYDTQKPYNLTDSDTNEGLLESELDWLDTQLDELLSANFDEDEDYTIPFQWNGARSRTVVLYSEKALGAFPHIVTGIQRILSHAEKAWIIYFQSDEVDEKFVVWIYPDKLVLTNEYLKAVRRLLKSHSAKSGQWTRLHALLKSFLGLIKGS